MKLIKNPAVLKELIQSEEAEWNLFFKSIRLITARELDQLIHPVAKNVSGNIDCRACSNCCHHLESGLNEEEIRRLSMLNNQSVDEFVQHETETEQATGIAFLTKKPCIFLTGGSCRIYNDRPSGCRDFPNLDKTGIKFRLRHHIAHMEICPIVYNTFYTLRLQLNN